MMSEEDMTIERKNVGLINTRARISYLFEEEGGEGREVCYQIEEEISIVGSVCQFK